MRSIVALALSSLCAGCQEDSSALTVLVDDMSNHVSSVVVDETLGVACLRRTVTTSNGHSSTTTVYTGACMAESDLPALANGRLRRPFDMTSYATEIVIDDDNGLVCFETGETWRGCVPEAKIHPNGLAWLRSLAQ